MDTQPDAVLELTPLDEIHVQTWLAMLPSQRVVRIKPLSLIAMISRGNVPNEFLSAVMDIASAEGPDLEKVDITEMMPLMIWMADQVLVDISIWNGQGKQPEGTVPPETFTDKDYSALFAWATQEQTLPFRAVSLEP